MARKRGGRKKVFRRKRNFRRRQRKMSTRKPSINVMKAFGFPDVCYVKLKYVDRITFNPGINVDTKSFRGNSIWDPDTGIGLGHQPMYRDEYGGIYNRYRVLGSSIHIDMINASGNSGLFYMTIPETDLSASPSISANYEQARAVAPRFVPIAQRVSSRMKQYASTRVVCGLKKSQLYDDDYAALFSTNPAQEWFWNIFLESGDAASAVSAYMVVKIVYYVQLFDRREGFPS